MSIRDLVIKPEFYKKLYPIERVNEMVEKQHPMLQHVGKPVPRRRRLWRRTKNALWWKPWALVHRIIPGGDCGCP